jgi:hypothetical protein
MSIGSQAEDRWLPAHPQVLAGTAADGQSQRKVLWSGHTLLYTVCIGARTCVNMLNSNVRVIKCPWQTKLRNPSSVCTYTCQDPACRLQPYSMVPWVSLLATKSDKSLKPNTSCTKINPTTACNDDGSDAHLLAAAVPLEAFVLREYLPF